MAMEFTFETRPFAAANYAEADTVLVMVCKECVPALAGYEMPDALRAALDDVLTDVELTRTDKVMALTVALPGRKALQQVLLCGIGWGKECTPANMRTVAGSASRLISKRSKSVLVLAPLLHNPARAHYLHALVQGLMLGAYEFNKYKSDAEPAQQVAVTVLTEVPSAEAEAAVRGAQIEARAVMLARGLDSEPGNVLYPETMAAQAQAIAERLKLQCTVLNEQQLAEQQYNALLAVGVGSARPPRLIALRYDGAARYGGAKQDWLAFVGKGITFDSGGISIKPDDGMGEMKDDMSGAGAVLAAVQAVAELQLPINVLGVLACAENMPGGRAQRPGDIVRTACGKTIEVISTDAEGRMALADGVQYAAQQGAATIVDIATLTGAVIIALGEQTSGIISNDDALVEQLKKAGKFAGESWWQLPSLPECREQIKSDVADIKNTGGRPGGCITGGLFVEHFVPQGTPWAHLDIGGTATAKSARGCIPKGCTGFGTLTLVELAKLYAQ